MKYGDSGRRPASLHRISGDDGGMLDCKARSTNREGQLSYEYIVRGDACVVGPGGKGARVQGFLTILSAFYWLEMKA